MGRPLPLIECLPAGVAWIAARGIAGYEPFTALQPWYLLPVAERFDAAARWPGGPLREPLVAFARRQDNDDIACATGPAAKVVVIEGWQGDSYVVVAEHDDVWAWLKAVIDDVAAWSEADAL